MGGNCMARPIKKGLDYFPLDVDFFQNKKIKILKSRYGVDGISIYLYLLCEIYKNGYYIPVDDDFVYIVADDLGMKSNKIKQVLNFLLERSLFDNKLFQSDKVLTSASIQRRFQLAVKERAKKTPIKVEGYWLLKKDETEPFIKVNSFFNNSQKNESFSEKNKENSQEEYIKESKGKESKGKESKKGKTLTPEEKEELIKEYGVDVVEDYINRTTQYHCCNLSTIKRWITEDNEKKQNRSTAKNSFKSFSQRNYTKEEIEALERDFVENNKTNI